MTPKQISFADKSVLVLAVTGFFVSLWLTYIHVRVHLDPFYESVCAMGSFINCDTAASSSFSVFGHLPLSVWAAAFYLVFGLLAIPNILKKESNNSGIGAFLALCAAALSVIYAYISIKYIGAVCIGCFGLHLLNFALLWICLRRAILSGGPPALLKRDIVALLDNRWILFQLAAFLVLIFVAGPLGGFPRYWETAAFRGGVHFPHGLTEGNLPWIGAGTPKVTVDEYFDYECPACRSSHRKLRSLLTDRADVIRVVRHDMSRVNCIDKDGVGIDDRCVMARAAFCASAQQHFWEFNDAFLADPRPGELHVRSDYALDLAGKLGIDAGLFSTCMNAPETFYHVESIHQEGLGRSIKSTPTYFVGNKMMHSKEILPMLQSL